LDRSGKSDGLISLNLLSNPNSRESIFVTGLNNISSFNYRVYDRSSQDVHRGSITTASVGMLFFKEGSYIFLVEDVDKEVVKFKIMKR